MCCLSLKKLEDDQQVVVTAYKLAAFKILRDFICISIHIESTDSMIPHPTMHCSALSKSR